MPIWVRLNAGLGPAQPALLAGNTESRGSNPREHPCERHDRGRKPKSEERCDIQRKPKAQAVGLIRRLQVTGKRERKRARQHKSNEKRELRAAHVRGRGA